MSNNVPHPVRSAAQKWSTFASGCVIALGVLMTFAIAFNVVWDWLIEASTVKDHVDHLVNAFLLFFALAALWLAVFGGIKKHFKHYHFAPVVPGQMHEFFVAGGSAEILAGQGWEIVGITSDGVLFQK